MPTMRICAQFDRIDYGADDVHRAVVTLDRDAVESLGQRLDQRLRLALVRRDGKAIGAAECHVPPAAQLLNDLGVIAVSLVVALKVGLGDPVRDLEPVLVEVDEAVLREAHAPLFFDALVGPRRTGGIAAGRLSGQDLAANLSDLEARVPVVSKVERRSQRREQGDMHPYRGPAPGYDRGECCSDKVRLLAQDHGDTVLRARHRGNTE